MYFTDDSLYPENMQPLVITAAPYAPSWLPGDAADIAVTWDEQVQAAVDCYNAGATVLHLHVRNPATGHLSTDFDHFNYLLGRLKEAVPKMIIQVGGSISFAPKGEGKKAKWLDYDTRHMLTELKPEPEFVTVAIGTCMMDVTQMWTLDDIKGTHLEDTKEMAAWAGMCTDAGPAFYLEHLKRLKKNGIQPYFPLAQVHQLEIVERLIRHGVYIGPAEHGDHHLRRGRVRLRSLRLDGVHSSHTPGCYRLVLGRHADHVQWPSRWQLFWVNTCGSVTKTTSGTASGSASRRSSRLRRLWTYPSESGRKVATAEEARKIMKLESGMTAS